jgi:hypothetical protein
MNSLSYSKYSFQKLIQFSNGKKVQDVPQSNRNGGPWRDPCGSSLSGKYLFGTKTDDLCLENFKLNGYSLLNYLRSHQETMWQMLLFLTQMDFF